VATRLYLTGAIPVDIHGNKYEIYFILNLTSNPTISQNIEFLKAITISLTTMLPVLLIFYIDLVPCQNSGSLSKSAITSHTLIIVQKSSL